MTIFLAPVRTNIVRLLNDYARPLGPDDNTVEDEVVLRHHHGSFETLAIVKDMSEEDDAVAFYAMKREFLTPSITGMSDEELEDALGVMI